MSQFIKFFGEQILVLWKFALLRKRILIFSPPPVGVVCYRGMFPGTPQSSDLLGWSTEEMRLGSEGVGLQNLPQPFLVKISFRQLLPISYKMLFFRPFWVRTYLALSNTVPVSTGQVRVLNELVESSRWDSYEGNWLFPVKNRMSPLEVLVTRSISKL